MDIKNIKGKKIILIMIIFIVIIISVRIPQLPNEIEVNMANINKLANMQIYYDMGNGFEESNSSRNEINEKDGISYARLKLPSKEFVRLRLDPIDNSETLIIYNIRLLSNGREVARLEGNKLIDVLISCYDIKQINLVSNGVEVQCVGTDPQLLLTEDFNNIYKDSSNQDDIYLKLLIISIISIVTLFLILYINSKWLQSKINILYIFFDKNYITMWKILSVVIVTSVFIAAIITSFNIHPDELVTYKAIEYYEHHNLAPDLRSPEIKDTFSLYGNNRLAESSLYYFIAGKITVLCNLIMTGNNFRVLNIMLLCIMCVICIKNLIRNKNSALMLALFTTPQLWYIYSYGTSDALDYFISFLCFYQVINKDSMLNYILENKITKKDWPKLFEISVLFSMLLMAKQNYYIIILFLAFILILRWAFINRESKKQLFFKYILVLVLCFSILGIRSIRDVYLYGGHKSEIKSQLKEEMAKTEFKLSTKPEDRYVGLTLKERGVSLKSILIDRGFLKESFKSFIGKYGYMNIEGSNMYYLIMLILYLILYLIIAFYNLYKTNFRVKITFVGLNLLMLLNVVISVYNSWYIDFQAQGRYLFPILILLGYSVNQVPNIFSNKIFKVVLMLLSILSIYSFILIGIKQLIAL